MPYLLWSCLTHLLVCLKILYTLLLNSTHVFFILIYYCLVFVLFLSWFLNTTLAIGIHALYWVLSAFAHYKITPQVERKK